jgi:hypothetical protein
MVVPMRGMERAAIVNSTHHDDTKPNWTKVSVTGFGSALRMLFDEVFDSADTRYLGVFSGRQSPTTPHTFTFTFNRDRERYQIAHRIYMHQPWLLVPSRFLFLKDTHNKLVANRRLQRLDHIRSRNTLCALSSSFNDLADAHAPGARVSTRHPCARSFGVVCRDGCVAAVV